ncbi:MAG: efflux RND transporter periplasmic adaptor subunit [Candidatus Nitrospinota bacterium M3_3B_026]
MTAGRIIKNAAVAGLGLVLAGVLLISSHSSMGVDSADISLAPVKRGGFEVRVEAVGTLDAERSYIVSSEIKGDRGKIIHLAPDGEWVEEGGVLVKFDPTPFEEEILSLGGKVKSGEAVLESTRQALEWEKSQVEKEIKVAELNYKSARLELSKLLNGDGPLRLAQLREEVEEKQQNYEKHKSFVKDLEELEQKGYSNPAEISLAREKTGRLKKLYEISREKYESYKNYVLPSQVESMKTKVSQAEVEAEQTKKGGEFRIGKAKAAIEKARQDLLTAGERLRQARAELEKTVIRAPFDGIVVYYETFRDNVKRKPRVGDTVWRNQPIMYLPDITSFVVKTRIREIDLHKIEKGQKADVRVDAYPGAELSGEVAAIGALAEKETHGMAGMATEKTFQVTVAVKGRDIRLRPGMTARVSVLSDVVENALVAPVSSVFSDARGKFAYRKTGAGFEKAYVKIGRRNEDFAEILSGLAEGQAVSLAEPGASLF